MLCGSSAGMNCWFEASTTDSFDLSRLAGLRDGLGFLPGSACPHYDGEDQRRPLYRRLIAEEGFPPGFAADDAAALVFEGTSLREVVCTVRARPRTGSTRTARLLWPPGCSDERQRRLVREWVRTAAAPRVSSLPPYAGYGDTRRAVLRRVSSLPQRGNATLVAAAARTHLLPSRS